MTGNAVDELAAVAANALVLAFGVPALRDGAFDNLGLTNAIARLALTRALEAQVPGFPGLWLDRLAEREHPAARATGPCPVAAGDRALERFLATVLRPGAVQGNPGDGGGSQGAGGDGGSSLTSPGT